VVVLLKKCCTRYTIALFILLMAVINFVNICISRSSQRMKEMGIRKVLGGLRKQLIWQFLTNLFNGADSNPNCIGHLCLARPYFANLATDIGGLILLPALLLCPAYGCWRW
jgi:putative ABC transport system permease protein